jgi:hypothetical protein
VARACGVRGCAEPRVAGATRGCMRTRRSGGRVPPPPAVPLTTRPGSRSSRTRPAGRRCG